MFTHLYLLDGILISTHCIIHFLYCGQDYLIKLVDAFIKLRPLKAFFLQGPPSAKNIPGHRRSYAPSHASPLTHVLNVMRRITQRTIHEKLRQPIKFRSTQ